MAVVDFLPQICSMVGLLAYDCAFLPFASCVCPSLLSSVISYLHHPVPWLMPWQYQSSVAFPHSPHVLLLLLALVPAVYLGIRLLDFLSLCHAVNLVVHQILRTYQESMFVCVVQCCANLLVIYSSVCSLYRTVVSSWWPCTWLQSIIHSCMSHYPACRPASLVLW